MRRGEFRVRCSVLFFLFAGRALIAADAPKVTRLSLEDALRMALGPETPGLEIARGAVAVAEGKVAEARGATAFTAQGVVSEGGLRVDLNALGIAFPKFSQLISTVQVSGGQGPYMLLDPHIEAAKTLIDKSAKRKVIAAREGIAEARSAVAEERETIAAEITRVYLEAVRASEAAGLASGNVEMAETMLDVANERHGTGLAEQSEVRRARMDANAARQKLLAAQGDQRRAVLRLIYLLGMNFRDALELTTPMARHAPDMSVEQAVAAALAGNPRLQTSRLTEQRLKLTDDAVEAGWLPVLSTFGNFGLDVVAPDPGGTGGAPHAFTFAAGVEVKMPIFDGHRRSLAHAGVEAQIAEEDLRERDLRRQVELNVRTAYSDLTEAAKQTDLAEENLRDASADAEEVRASRGAGNASGLELQQAQNREAAAADARMAALYAEAQARVALAEAMGNVSSLKW